jgi:hypothetical protein
MTASNGNRSRLQKEAISLLCGCAALIIIRLDVALSARNPDGYLAGQTPRYRALACPGRERRHRSGIISNVP